MRVEIDLWQAERLYRAVADREPTRELLELVYDMLGSQFKLRPPVDEIRLAERCARKAG